MPLDHATMVVDQLVTDIINVAPLQSYFSDVYMAWELLLAMVGVAFAVSLLYSVLIRYFAGCMVWTMIFVLMILLLLIGAVSALLPHTQFLKDLFKYDDLPETLKDRGFQVAVSIISFVIFGIGFLLICCMKRQIAICIDHMIQLLELSRQLLILSEAVAGLSSFLSISPSYNFCSWLSGLQLSSFSSLLEMKK